ncbi:MAG: hypothetical protein AABW57_00710 [Nanoarchaeota archaeon]
MFKIYGIFGIIMILFAELNFYFKIEPFASWYFPIIWFGYIFIIDALIYKLKGHSLIMSRKEQFLKALLLSALIWWLFELINLKTLNWNYLSTTIYKEPLWFRFFIFRTISFSTILPAVIETYELIKTFKLFNKVKLLNHHDITHKFLHGMTYTGLIMLILTVIYPKYFFPFIWGAFFFILDPINYLHKQPSIIGYWKSGNIKVPFALFVTGILCGLLWEFWNYYAVVKWSYEIPFVGFFKIFEMPILGYLGYGPFAFELFSMWYFVKSLHSPKTTHSFLELNKI